MNIHPLELHRLQTSPFIWAIASPYWERKTLAWTSPSSRRTYQAVWDNNAGTLYMGTSVMQTGSAASVLRTFIGITGVSLSSFAEYLGMEHL